MHIHIAADGQVTLDQPGDFTAFDVRAADQDQFAVLGALGDVGSPTAEADHVFVSVDGVRSLARIAMGDGMDFAWESGFEGMLAYATSKAWMNDDGSAIKAHIEPLD